MVIFFSLNTYTLWLLGDGTTIAMSFPVWVSLFAHFVWKNESADGDGHNSAQRLDLFGWICVLAGFLGILFSVSFTLRKEAMSFVI